MLNRHFKVGWWIAVDEYLGGPKETPWGASTPSVDYDGTPLKILAVSMPFLCVCNGKDPAFGLDTREWGVTILNPNFVKKMLEDKPIKEDQKRILKLETKAQKKRRRKNEKPHPYACPNCGCRRIEKLIEPGTGQWFLHCPNCGHSGDPVPI